MSLKYDIEKREILNPSSNFSFFNVVIFLLLACQKMKLWGCSLAVYAAHGHFYTLRGFNHQFVVSVCWCRTGDCPFRVDTETEKQRKVPGGERPESSLSRTVFLFTLSHVDHPRP